MARPRVALILTTWYQNSHADVLATGLINGYDWNGEHIDPRIEVVSVYLEQLGLVGPAGQKPDVGVPIIETAKIPFYPTPAEALGAGSPGVNVDGVIIIGEHGNYEFNEYGQKLYPRRRLFDSVLSAMIAADRYVPVFNDKHLAWNFTDAKAMYDNARRLGVPLLAGSTIPIAWRKPKAAEWPLNAPMDKVIAAAYGGFEGYGYHALEGIQAFAERRTGGESGVAEVRGFTGDDVDEAVARLDPALLRAAVAAHQIDDAAIDEAIEQISQVIITKHRDGLESAMVMSKALSGFAVAASGPDHHLSCEMHLQGPPFSHFLFLGRAAETLIIEGRPPYPVERTLLTGGIIDHALRTAHGAAEPETPHLDISYTVPEHIADTGVPLDTYQHGDS